MTKPWKKLKEKNLFKGKFRSLIGKTYQLPDGNQGEFEIKASSNNPEVACVLAVTNENKFILVEQYRPGPEKGLLGLPAGALDEGETAIEAAKREMLEETGYQGKLKQVASLPREGYSNEIDHIFIATECKKVQEQQLDEQEFIEVIQVDLEELKRILPSGQMSSVEAGLAYIGLDFLNLI